MKTIKFLLLLLPAVFAWNLQAQNLTVRGTITDASNGAPVPYASVVVKSTSAWTTSDADGRYEIQAPSNGTLSVAILGYQEEEVDVNGRTTVNIALNPELDQLSESVVIG